MTKTWDMHGGYGLCSGPPVGGKVWVDDGEQSNWYVGGTCPRCDPEGTPNPRTATMAERLSPLEVALEALAHIVEVGTRTSIRRNADDSLEEYEQLSDEAAIAEAALRDLYRPVRDLMARERGDSE